MDNLGHWTTQLTVPNEFFGFIYRITCVGNGRWYLGKKQAAFKTCKAPLKGNKNKRRGTKESDWKTYTGSCKKLNADIDIYGLECFNFEIVKFCTSKSDLSYSETTSIIQSNALFCPQSYNEYLLVRLRNPKK